MKKILFLTSFFIFGVTGISNAQFQEGSLMLGTDLGSGLVTSNSGGLFSLNFGLNEGAGYNVGISPKIGYFISDDFLIGGIVNLGFTKSAENSGVSTKTTVYGIQGLARYYMRPNEVDLEEVDSGWFFVEANAGIAGVNVTDGPTTNGFAFGFGPGYSYFLNSNIALEVTAKYNGLVGGGNTTYQHALGLNVGIQVFLPSAEAEEAVEEFE
ncbi:MAG TPA: hypothetical protein VFI78_01200 [Salinimicrobium sp.]|nr:hypothetical protein [Salinimicrobium sp.]